MVPRCIHSTSPLPHHHCHSCHSLYLCQSLSCKISSNKILRYDLHLEISPFIYLVLCPIAITGMTLVLQALQPDECLSHPVEGKPSNVHWQQGQSWLLGENVEWEAIDGGMLKVMGIICRTLSMNAWFISQTMEISSYQQWCIFLVCPLSST